ncbi:MAG: hypothetical protein ACI8W8_001795 [Rhodothermales bacterium]|jgi:hypothetical protein
MPPTHKKTLTAGLGVFAICALIYFVAVHPMKLKADRMKAEIKERESELRIAGFPLMPSKLQDINNSMLALKTGTHQNFDRVYDMSMAGFKERIEIYDTVDSFRRSITRFDFQEAYARISDELADEQVYLNGEVLGLSAGSSAKYDYHLLTHLWVVRDLALLVRRHELEVGDGNLIKPVDIRAEESALEEDQRRWQWETHHPPANLSIMPVKRYATKDGADPFLEEFPVRIVVRGTLRNYCNMLADLTEGGTFLPVDTSEVRKVGLDNPRSDSIEGTLVVSAFLFLKEKSQLVERVKVKVTKRRWQRGA